MGVGGEDSRKDSSIAICEVVAGEIEALEGPVACQETVQCLNAAFVQVVSCKALRWQKVQSGKGERRGESCEKRPATAVASCPLTDSPDA